MSTISIAGLGRASRKMVLLVRTLAACVAVAGAGLVAPAAAGQVRISFGDAVTVQGAAQSSASNARVSCNSNSQRKVYRYDNSRWSSCNTNSGNRSSHRSGYNADYTRGHNSGYWRGNGYRPTVKVTRCDRLGGFEICQTVVKPRYRTRSQQWGHRNQSRWGTCKNSRSYGYTGGSGWSGSAWHWGRSTSQGRVVDWGDYSGGSYGGHYSDNDYKYQRYPQASASRTVYAERPVTGREPVGAGERGTVSTQNAIYQAWQDAVARQRDAQVGSALTGAAPVAGELAVEAVVSETPSPQPSEGEVMTRAQMAEELERLRAELEQLRSGQLGPVAGR